MKGRIFMLLLLTSFLAFAQEGAIDNSFNNNSFIVGRILNIVDQLDGKLLIGGKFIKYGGNGRSVIARLNTEGSKDNTFVPISWSTITFRFFYFGGRFLYRSNTLFSYRYAYFSRRQPSLP